MANHTGLTLNQTIFRFLLVSVILLVSCKLFEANVEFLNTTTIIARHGYPVESHVVATEDGYLLTVHRIPSSPKTPNGTRHKKTPILLQHGISVASEAWVLTGPERGLGFLLADEGYDVWLANSRGNYYSRNHLTLAPQDKQFWNFTFHEMGIYDLPAVIDHVLNTTRQDQLVYIGHSMGCTVFYVMTSQRPEYNKKVRLMIAFAPAVYNGQQGSFSDTFSRLTLWGARGGEIQRRTRQEEAFWNSMCREGSKIQFTCVFLYNNVYGYNNKALNTTMLPLYVTRLQSGTSAKTLDHFVQIFEIERFQMYDHTAMKTGNISVLPEYDLTNVDVPMVIFYGDNDAIIRPKGVFRLRDALLSVIQTIRVADDDFNHVDFLFADNVKKVLYDDIITLLRNH